MARKRKRPQVKPKGRWFTGEDLKALLINLTAWLITKMLENLFGIS